MFDFLKKKVQDEATGTAGKALDTVTQALSNSPNSASKQASPASGKHTVKPGESLSKIAKQHNISLKQIIAANPQIKNPDLIHPNDEVNLS